MPIFIPLNASQRTNLIINFRKLMEQIQQELSNFINEVAKVPIEDESKPILMKVIKVKEINGRLDTLHSLRQNFNLWFVKLRLNEIPDCHEKKTLCNKIEMCRK